MPEHAKTVIRWSPCFLSAFFTSCVYHLDIYEKNLLMMVKVLIGQLRDFRMLATDEGCECASCKKQPKLKCLWSFCRFEQDLFCAFMLSISIRSEGKYLKRQVALWLFPFPGSPFTVGGLLLCSYFLSLRQHSCWLGRRLKE